MKGASLSRRERVWTPRYASIHPALLPWTVRCLGGLCPLAGPESWTLSGPDAIHPPSSARYALDPAFGGLRRSLPFGSLGLVRAVRESGWTPAPQRRGQARRYASLHLALDDGTRPSQSALGGGLGLPSAWARRALFPVDAWPRWGAALPSSFARGGRAKPSQYLRPWGASNPSILLGQNRSPLCR